MRRPGLVATDLDGTLLRDDGTVSARTAAALAALPAAGIELVVVTARPPRWVDDLAFLPAHGVVICVNGAVVYDVAHRRVLEHRAMPDATVRALVADLRRAMAGVTFAAERPAGFAAERAYLSIHPVPDDAVFARGIEDTLDGTTVKLLVRCHGMPEADVVPTVAAVCAGRAAVMHSGAGGLAEVHDPKVSKAAALARWAARRGFGPADVWAFGDMPNDLPMLGWAGRSFAVANAHPAVLAAADDVCGSNEADGVAAVLESLLGPVPPADAVTRRR